MSKLKAQAGSHMPGDMSWNKIQQQAKRNCRSSQRFMAETKLSYCRNHCSRRAPASFLHLNKPSRQKLLGSWFPTGPPPHITHPAACTNCFSFLSSKLSKDNQGRSCPPQEACKPGFLSSRHQEFEKIQPQLPLVKSRQKPAGPSGPTT